MKLAVIGSRGFDNYQELCSQLDKIEGITEIVSGGAKGADSLAEKYAHEKGLKLAVFKPDYAKWGKGAPHVRNSEIVAYCDVLVAFWDGESPGTRSTIEKAKKAGKSVQIYKPIP